MADPEAKADNGKIYEILLVEDNEDDASLTMELLEEDETVRSNVSWVEDGEEALAFLRKEGKYAEAPRPALVLLDLSLPRMGGLEVLAVMKRDPTIKRIPVVILSHSTSERDIAESYNRFANCYVTKTGDVGTFHNAVRQLERFWLCVAKLATT